MGAFYLPHSALAQAPPTPDSELVRQQQRTGELRQRLETSADVRLGSPSGDTRSRLPETETPCFPIDRVQLAGDAAAFGDITIALAGPERDDPPEGRCLGARGIQLLVERLQNELVARGFVTTRVAAQAQDLKSGRLSLTVFPGHLGHVRMSDRALANLFVRAALPSNEGDLVNLRDLEQALENLRRLPTAEAGIEIVPGEMAGQSDLLFSYRQEKPWRLGLSVDDAGSKSTGKYQGSLTFSYDNGLGLNDLFYLALQQDLGGRDVGERGSRGHVLHYSLPLGYWLFGWTGSRNRYHQTVPGAAQTYLYSGNSSNHELQLSRLVQRNATGKTTLALKGFSRRSSNFIDDTEVEVQRRRTGGWEAALLHTRYLERGTLDAQIAYRHGTGAFGSLPAPEEDFGEGTSRMRLITAGLGWQAPFSLGPAQFLYSGHLRGQWNRSPLTPPDRFCVGGRYTVRGFDGEQTLCAERGLLWRNEASTGLGDLPLRAYLGIDYGRVDGPSSEFLAGRRLTGMVIGLRVVSPALQLDVFAGQPLRKPEAFQTAATTLGFNLNVSF